MERKIKDLSVIELKAIIWDLEQEILLKQNNRNQVLGLLKEKIKESIVKENTDGDN